LLLTGQRRGEAAGATWEEIDLGRGLWTIPGSRTKTGEPSVVPLTPQVVELLRGLPTHGREGALFPSRWAAENVTSFSTAQARADRLAGVTGWHLHDLRRTAASGMARLGVEPHVIEKVLNHKTGQLGGVAGIYNRFGYLPEKRRALELWADGLDAVAAGLPLESVLKVVPLRRGA
jgi:integrase